MAEKIAKKVAEKIVENKVVLITGAARRIGASIADYFHRRGFRVIVHCNRSADEAGRLVAELNRRRPQSAVCLQADLRESKQASGLATQALEQFDRLDVLINNASGFYSTEFGQVERAHWDDLMGSNLSGAFFLSQSLSIELGKRKGTIINVIDTHADKPLAGHSVYSIAKAGLKAMTKSLAIELAPDVRVNGVSPGAILWPPELQDSEDASVLESRDKILQQIILGRLGKPENIAEAVYFLAEEATYITGQVIRVDGGRHLS